MKAKHTPGPWIADTWSYRNPDTGKFDRHVPCIYSPVRGMRIAILDSDEGKSGNPYTFTLDEARANAQLIAVAPDLLEALRRLTGEIDKLRIEFEEQFPALAEAYTLARVAIAKATGAKAAHAEFDDKLESEAAR